MQPILNQQAKEKDYTIESAPLSDRELFARIAQGDEAALSALYQKYRGDVYRFLVYQVNDTQLAEEILQDVFLAAWQRAASFRGDASVKTWLLRVAYYRSTKWLTDKRKPNEVELSDKLDSGQRLPEESSEIASEIEHLREMLEYLSPKHRTALELIFFHELTYKEAAQVMGCPVGTMKSRVSHALAQMQGLLHRSGWEEQ